MIDPVRLIKIQYSTTVRTMKKFSNLRLDFDDIHSEAKIGTMLSVGKFDESRGYPLYSYIYSNTMNHLRNYVNRKVVPQMIVSEEQEKINIEIVHASTFIPSVVGRVEARDQLSKLKEELDEVSLEILKYIEKDISHRDIAKLVNLSRQAVDKRVIKMREFLVASSG